MTVDEARPAVPLPRAIGVWLREGARSALLCAPRLDTISQSPATPALVLALVLLATAASAFGEWLALVGPADFHWRSLVSGWFTTSLTAWLCWWTAAPRPDADPQTSPPPAAATLFALLAAQGLVIVIASVAAVTPVLRFLGPGWVAWALWWVTVVWIVLAQLGLLWRYARPGPRVGIALLTVAGAPTWVLAPSAPSWLARDEQGAGTEPSFLRLTPDLIERQQQVAGAALDGLAPQRPGRVDLYVLTFAPYGDEDVFRRESALVAGVLDERFGAAGRTLQLVNHPRTAEEFAWATPANLRRAIERVAQRMDRDEDLLLVHLASHGARDGRLSAQLWPLDMPVLTPAQLRVWLDEAGIRHRIVSVSACYAGSWIEPLATDGTLVMTAADAEHTSYGCGSKSDLTYFGRAMFDEQLRSTRSFEQAHAAAREVIARREREAGKADGYSNPQIRVGAAIREPLARLTAELESETGR
ncbi:MAG TPA: C13 family peptidase [Methylibium sp.]|nr:C13 family peptidase [Methylibium sp.]